MLILGLVLPTRRAAATTGTWSTELFAEEGHDWNLTHSKPAAFLDALDCTESVSFRAFGSDCGDITTRSPGTYMVFGRYGIDHLQIAGQLASLALDIFEIENATSIEEAMEIYENGKNALANQDWSLGAHTSLSSLSKVGARLMTEDHVFNIFKFALYDEQDFRASNPADFAFADDFIQRKAVEMDNSDIIAEASVVMNIWMIVAHHLQEAIRVCTSSDKNPTREIDAAVSIWLGTNQIEGSHTVGWSLYAMSQKAANVFGRPDGEESPVNTQLFSLFNETKVTSKSCTIESDAHKRLRTQVKECLRLLMIPLVQNLLQSIASEDQDRTELYATAVVPQLAACHPLEFQNLTALLNDGEGWNSLDPSRIGKLVSFLDCLGITCTDLAFSGTSPSALRSLVGTICPQSAVASQKASLVEGSIYDAASKIELDILQVGIMMRVGAIEAAKDLYMYGWNAQSEPGWLLEDDIQDRLALRQLASLQENNPVTGLRPFGDFYGTSSYGNLLVSDALSQAGGALNETPTQLISNIESILEVLVLFQGMIWFLEQTSSACLNSDFGQASVYWRSAMGIFDGSEGLFSLRRLSVEACEWFDTCIDESSVLAAVIDDTMNNGYTYMERNECNDSQDDFASEIIVYLKAIAMQGLLANALYFNETRLETSFPSGHVFSQALLPFISDISSESAETIAALFDGPSSKIESIEELDSFLQTLQFVIPAMDISCDFLGSWSADPTIIICSDYDAPTSTVPHSNLGLDVKDIKYALSDGEVEAARHIYENGKHALHDQELISLQDLSTTLDQGAVFELHRLMNQGAYDYIDVAVQEALESDIESTQKITAETIVAMDVWMGVLHFMSKAIVDCRVPSANLTSIAGSVHQAAALYFGDADTNSDEAGNLLFGMAREMSNLFESFGVNVPKVNDIMISLFGQSDDLLSSTGSCTEDSIATVNELNEIVNEMARQMTIPLVQGLIHALKLEDHNRIRLYARTVNPLISQCNESTYRLFQDTLVDGSLEEDLDIEPTIDRVYESLACLRLTCSDIGYHLIDATSRTIQAPRPACETPTVDDFFGYKPFDSQAFERLLRLDQDLREIDLFLRADSFAAASQVYQYGRHNDMTLREVQESIHSQSRISSRGSFHEVFSSYYGTYDYIEELVWSPLHNGTFGEEHQGLNGVERATLAVGLAQMVLMPHGALASMEASLQHCGDNDGSITAIMMTSWDQVAALLLGSAPLTGSGRLSWHDLAQTTCSIFDTCQEDGAANASYEVVGLLYAGIGALQEASSCENVTESFILKLQPYLLVPILQEMLQASRFAGTMDRAFVASRAILPLLQPTEADRLESLFRFGRKYYDRSVTAATMDLLSEALPNLNIECEWIGALDGMSPCRSDNLERFQQELSNDGLSAGAWVGITLGMVALLLTVVFCWCKRRDRVSRGVPLGKRTTSAKLSRLFPGSNKSPPSDHSNTYPAEEWEFDTERIGKSFSFKRKMSGASYKAKRALDRIRRYGDDDPQIVPTAQNNSFSSTKSKSKSSGGKKSSSSSSQKSENSNSHHLTQPIPGNEPAVSHSGASSSWKMASSAHSSSSSSMFIDETEDII